MAEGDELTTVDGKRAVVTSIEKVVEDTEVYNIEDDVGINNYVVGGFGGSSLEDELGDGRGLEGLVGGGGFGGVVVHNSNELIKQKMIDGTRVIESGDQTLDLIAKRALIKEIQRMHGINDVEIVGICEPETVTLYRTYWPGNLRPEIKDALLNSRVIYPKGLTAEQFQAEVSKLYQGRNAIPRDDFAQLVFTQATRSTAKLAISATPSKTKALNIYRQAISQGRESYIVRIRDVRINDLEVASGGLTHDLEFTLVGKKSALGIEGGYNYELIKPEDLVR